MPEKIYRRTMYRETERYGGMMSWAVRTWEGNVREIRETFYP
jgi:hypothetical protein